MLRYVRLARRAPARLLTLAACLALLSAPAVAVAVAAGPEPATKDSRAGVKPKEATLAASITPAEARPGETVTLAVTAKLSHGWHIYGYNKAQPDDGPRVTQFDVFDPAGLTPKGDWTPSKPPTRKKETAYPDLPFVEFHEDEVTWNLPMVVPADARPGKRSVRVQAAYQVCSDQSCSFPGRWTLPDVELTIVAAGGPKLDQAVARAGTEAAPAPAVSPASEPKKPLSVVAWLTFVLTPAPSPASEPKKPARKDTRPEAKPKGVVLTPGVSPSEARPGDTVTYTVAAKVNGKNHIYKYSKTEAESGPTLTSFDFFDPAGLIPQGDWTPSKEPIKRHEPRLKDIPFLEFYEDEVTWSLPLVVPPGAEPGKRTLRCQAGYMVCDDKNCSIPGQWTLPDVELTILPAGAALAAATPNPAGAAPAPVVAAAPVVPEAAPAPKPAEVATATPTPAPEPARGDKAAVSDIERQAESGLIPFLLTCAGGGLLALMMPCVWPMIPITVNFFVKQGQKKKGATTGLAVAYCLAIIGVFTAVGVLFAVFFGAASLSKLANNPWVNFAVAGLFLAFGLSLLGLFEIRLPNFLLNASAQGEGKGGMVGVMFMALTLTITSFTCTFPVVGGLLGIAARGTYVYPVIGMMTFAGVIALPFFVLALSPGLMAKVPKSGDWMNAVKVVGGLVEIGAAFKFINTAETAFVLANEAYFNAYAVLTIWIVLALVCGVYLLGLFRTDHDQEAVKVGPGRIVLGCFFLFVALFLTPALFGRPPQSRFWYTVVGLLPADAGDLKAPTGSGGPGTGPARMLATSTDPKKAEREQTDVHGVVWGMSYEAALEEAKAKGKPILIDFTGVNCANCRLMEQEVLPRAEVVAALGQFVTIQLYTDFAQINGLTAEQKTAIAEANLDRELKLTGEATNPLYVVLGPDERVLGVKGGKMTPGEFLGHLNASLDKHRGGQKVARPAGPGEAAPSPRDRAAR